MLLTSPAGPNLRRHLTAKPLRVGKNFLMFILIVMAGVMSLLYLMHFTDTHTKGYLIRKLELEHDTLRVTQEGKQMSIDKVKSLTHIQNSETVQRMVPATAASITFLKPEAEVAIR